MKELRMLAEMLGTDEDARVASGEEPIDAESV
jgi:hypothetical protein